MDLYGIAVAAFPATSKIDKEYLGTDMTTVHCNPIQVSDNFNEPFLVLDELAFTCSFRTLHQLENCLQQLVDTFDTIVDKQLRECRQAGVRQLPVPLKIGQALENPINRDTLEYFAFGKSLFYFGSHHFGSHLRAMLNPGAYLENMNKFGQLLKSCTWQTGNHHVIRSDPSDNPWAKSFNQIWLFLRQFTAGSFGVGNRPDMQEADRFLAENLERICLAFELGSKAKSPYKPDVVESLLKEHDISESVHSFLDSHFAYRHAYSFGERLRQCDECIKFESLENLVQEIFSELQDEPSKYITAHALILAEAFRDGTSWSNRVRENDHHFAMNDVFQDDLKEHVKRPYRGHGYLAWSEFYREAFYNGFWSFYEGQPDTLRLPHVTIKLPFDDCSPFFTDPCADMVKEIHQVNMGRRSLEHARDERSTRSEISIQIDEMERSFRNLHAQGITHRDLAPVDRDFQSALSLEKRRHFQNFDLDRVEDSKVLPRTTDEVKFALLAGYVAQLDKLLTNKAIAITEDQEIEIRMMAEFFGIDDVSLKLIDDVVRDMWEIVADYERLSGKQIRKEHVDQLLSQYRSS